MNYVSGLMLGASIANMLRQTLGGAGTMNAAPGQGMGGGRGRAAQGGAVPAGFPAMPGGMGSASSPLTGLLGMMGRAGEKPAGQRTAAEPAGEKAAQVRRRDPAEPPFSLVHASPGRRRYRTPYLTAEFAKVLEELLPRLPFVTTVRANAVEGSILLVYPPADEAHVLVLAEGLEAIFAEGRTAPPPATLAQSVRRSVHAFSGWIQRNTGGALDLSSVVAGVFILRGVRQLVLGSNTPSGSQMLWWALTLMRGWKV